MSGLSHDIHNIQVLCEPFLNFKNRRGAKMHKDRCIFFGMLLKPAADVLSKRGKSDLGSDSDESQPRPEKKSKPETGGLRVPAYACLYAVLHLHFLILTLQTMSKMVVKIMLETRRRLMDLIKIMMMKNQNPSRTMQPPQQVPAFLCLLVFLRPLYFSACLCPSPCISPS